MNTRTHKLLLWGLLAGEAILMAAQFEHNRTSNLLDDNEMTVIRRGDGSSAGFWAPPTPVLAPAGHPDCRSDDCGCGEARLAHSVG